VCVEGRTIGRLPLAFVRSRIFGRFLVSLPFINTGGVVAADDAVARQLVDQAVALADKLDVRYLELRHERPIEHPRLTGRNESKVHMRLRLPATADELWQHLKAKVRNQVRKGESQPGAEAHWGRQELLDEFYDIFSHNMRDLGTPTFGKPLFKAILDEFSNEAELCVVRHGLRPVAAAVLVHGDGTTAVPNAGSLRRYNATNANMLMYWKLLERAVQRGSRVFDFGRSTIDSNTFRFKRQWGAEPYPAVWQYYVRRGTIGDLRPDNPKFRLAIQAWRRMPLALSRWIGPSIACRIP
jgi:FemAB-related protein (PEP-CTERM system-associated)